MYFAQVILSLKLMNSIMTGRINICCIMDFIKNILISFLFIFLQILFIVLINSCFINYFIFLVVFHFLILLINFFIFLLINFLVWLNWLNFIILSDSFNFIYLFFIIHFDNQILSTHTNYWMVNLRPILRIILFINAIILNHSTLQI